MGVKPTWNFLKSEYEIWEKVIKEFLRNFRENFRKRGDQFRFTSVGENLGNFELIFEGKLGTYQSESKWLGFWNNFLKFWVFLAIFESEAGFFGFLEV